MSKQFTNNASVNAANVSRSLPHVTPADDLRTTCSSALKKDRSMENANRAALPVAKPHIEEIFRRISEASARLQERAIRARRQTALALYKEAVSACAVGARIQSDRDFYRQLEWSVLISSGRNALPSESSFRRHVNLMRKAIAAGVPFSLHSIKRFDNAWRAQYSPSEDWLARRVDGHRAKALTGRIVGGRSSNPR